MLRNLSNKISRMETQPRQAQKNVNRPSRPYIRPFQPHIVQRERQNTYQQIQPPLMIDDQDFEE